MQTIRDLLLQEVNKALEEAKRACPDLDRSTRCVEVRMVTAPTGTFFQALIDPYPADPDLRRRAGEVLSAQGLTVELTTRW